jgi:hypothetical protein
MTFIEVKTSVHLSKDTKIALKTQFGKDITLIPGKTETVTMVGLLGDYDLFLGGEMLEFGAYVEIKMFKPTTREIMASLNTAICDTLENILSIPRSHVYITFFGQPEWGSRGTLL